MPQDELHFLGRARRYRNTSLPMPSRIATSWLMSPCIISSIVERCWGEGTQVLGTRDPERQDID